MQKEKLEQGLSLSGCRNKSKISEICERDRSTRSAIEANENEEYDSGSQREGAFFSFKSVLNGFGDTYY